MKLLWESWDILENEMSSQKNLQDNLTCVFSNCKGSPFLFMQQISSSEAASLGLTRMTAQLHSVSVYQNSMGSHSEDCTWASPYVLICLNLIHIYINFSHPNILHLRYTTTFFSFSSIFSFSLVAYIYYHVKNIEITYSFMFLQKSFRPQTYLCIFALLLWFL